MSRKNEKENASCIICGNKYFLCIACERNKADWKPWKIITDTEKCFKIYDILNKYNFKKISKEEAKEKLSLLNLDNLDIFKDSVKKQIEKINETTNKEKTVEVVEKVLDVAEETKVDVAVEEVVETVETVETSEIVKPVEVTETVESTETVKEDNIETVSKKFRKRSSKKVEE